MTHAAHLFSLLPKVQNLVSENIPDLGVAGPGGRGGEGHNITGGIAQWIATALDRGLQSWTQ